MTVLCGITLAIETGLTLFVIEIGASAMVKLILAGIPYLADVCLIIREILSNISGRIRFCLQKIFVGL
ncbi:hypothetical protein LWI28_027649 [Acer negundo]|uniref:Uncharacterized protein n=1 Tax=Acer negundo TaxID=4023 RepID=A0AAD5IXM2_ACENE|nr:hypothetical protein LWI28_027649 [Acer negundo]